MSDAWSLLFAYLSLLARSLKYTFCCVILDYDLCRIEYNFLLLDVWMQRKNTNILHCFSLNLLVV